MKVLIADDNAQSRLILQRSLTRWGYDAVMAENGAEAWEILADPDSAPPMAILDWMMPHMTGPELCRRVRETHREPYTYILLLTSMDSKDSTVEGLEAGADDYIVKPFEENELRVRLRAGKRIIDLQMHLLQAREELRERANKDLLTMLPNRSAIAAALERELARCHRDRRTVGVILLDIDHFKRINDTYGHFAGDAVLRETASRLRHNMRPYDQVGRYGGEEFLVVLPDTPLDGACRVAETMMRDLAGLTIDWKREAIRLTASFGVTAALPGEVDTEALIARADAALYLAKE
ncbi:MAG: diguanylate cyclase, partial [Acidobacteriaceae bacterium]|nr:diguanylate cyclase [Acidobacteriaceae bacterium]